MATEQLLLTRLLAIFEGLTGFVASITSDHAYIHKGYAWTSIIELPEATTTYYVGFKTPSTESGKYVHWRPAGLQSSLDYITFQLYEGDTFSGGTTNTPINRNRNMTSAVSDMQSISTGATATPVGTVIQLAAMGSAGNNQSRSGGASGADQELVLKPDTDYVIEITRDGSTAVTMELFWYEESGYTA